MLRGEGLPPLPRALINPWYRLTSYEPMASVDEAIDDAPKVKGSTLSRRSGGEG